MRLARRRAGVSLAELLVAAAVASVLLLAVASVFRHLTAAIARDARRGRVEAVAAEALAVVRALVASAAGVTVVGDSVLVIDALVADVRPCVDGTVIPVRLLPEMFPTAGDRWLGVTRRSAADGTEALAWHVVTPRPLVSALAGCADADTAWPLFRITRRQQVSSYRASDGRWMLGLQTCLDRCHPPQPLAGPLEPPQRHGWHVRAAACGIELGVRPLGDPAARWLVVQRC